MRWGADNLGSCAGTLDDTTDQGGFGSEGGPVCVLDFVQTCSASSQIVIGLTVSNNTAGVTTASVTLNVTPN